MIESKTISADAIPECFEQLLVDITKAEYELDGLYEKIHDVQQRLTTMRYKQSLMKLYLRKF